MRAAVLNQFDQPLDLEELAAPDLGPADVRVRVDASGVCHSDLSIQHGHVPYPLPVILGHEGCGTVVEVGGSVTRARVGDRVIGSFVPACGDCWFCRHAKPNLCTGRQGAMFASHGTRPDGQAVPGMSGLGTFAEEVVTDQAMVVPVRTDLPPEQLALIGCGITTGVGAALNTAGVEPGDSVAVIGCGGVGQSVIQGARIAGAARIFAVDPLEPKRQAAVAFGATDQVDPGAGDPVEQIRQATGGRGVDHAFEVLGRAETIAQAYAVARHGGTAVVVGMARPEVTVTLSALDLMSTEKRLVGCLYGSADVRRDFPRFVELAETGRLDLESMVSRRISLEQVNEALEACERGDVIRSVITFA